ncbi:metallophosphoesterase family protein [Chelativorans intermedius]|uniref:Metallophosphoesterase family protein n=1 Tax=Chelativorans intermedius TaxID=515947 RepID=A0ABV6DB97_9HYPH|nr:metallophosphoesterase [Chelativorans intermedius]MCT9000244.1 metallophosphoesterase [Chelativorans intermedius]
MTLSVLHISDLHRDPANPIGNQVLLDSLERDRDRYTSHDETRIAPPNLIIVSGDIVQGVRHGTADAESALRKQYDEALVFLNELTDRFVGGDKRRVILIPGNHDVSDHHFRQSLTPIEMTAGIDKALVAELFKPDSPLRWSWDEFSLFEITDRDMYRQRFAAFVDFYDRFYDGQRSYSLEPNSQLDVFELPDLEIVVVGFCSCYNNDLLNRQGAIHPDCIARAGRWLRQLSGAQEYLRIAVWHHNTEGPPAEVDYMDPDIVQNLIDGGFSLGFHGHQHKPQFLDTRFRHGPDRRITVISAGTLCGGAAFRHGRAYNVVELDIPNRKGRLHVREMHNDNLRMPIWGARSLPPNQTGYLDFTFDPPPEPFVRADRNTLLLTKVQGLYDQSEYRAAADILSPLAPTDGLARRLLLDCLVKLDDAAGVMAAFDPPESTAEAIALLDALWTQGNKRRIAEIIELPLIAGSTDPSIVEIRTKYAARLKK